MIAIRAGGIASGSEPTSRELHLNIGQASGEIGQEIMFAAGAPATAAVHYK